MSETEIIHEIAEGKTYETEYDGRMYHHCAFCDVDLEQEDHSYCCLMVMSRTLLGDNWREIVEKQRKHVSKVVLKHNKKVSCEFCHVNVREDSLTQHQENSTLCLKLQGRYEEVECEYCHQSVGTVHLKGHQNGNTRCKRIQRRRQRTLYK